MDLLLTYIEDVDIEMLKYLDAPYIIKLCLLNQYTNRLCHDKKLWHAKIKLDHLQIPNFIKGDLNWSYVYVILTHINSIINNGRMLRVEFRLKRDTVQNLFNQSDIDYGVAGNVCSLIIVLAYEKKDFNIGLGYYSGGGMEYPVTFKQLFWFMYYCYQSHYFVI
jgi:hypothetical protein